jgi:hypothetical protein
VLCDDVVIETAPIITAIPAAHATHTIAKQKVQFKWFTQNRSKSSTFRERMVGMVFGPKDGLPMDRTIEGIIAFFFVSRGLWL